MSLYSFAATNLTTTIDRRRRPAVSQAQIARTFGMVLIFLLAAVAIVHHGRVQGLSGIGQHASPVKRGPSAEAPADPLPASF